MVKRYFEFIKEHSHDNQSIGEWVEELYNDDQIKNIVNRYIDDIDSDIRLSNAINILDDKTKEEIKYYIDEYLKNGIIEKDPTVDAYVDMDELVESDITIAGKGIFTSFLKTITALGQKESVANFDKCPDDFILFYYYPNMDSEVVKSIFNRFRSLVKYSELVDYSKNEVDIYFGIKTNSELEYGISYGDQRNVFGSFRLTSSVIKWVNNLESKAAFSLKKELVNLTYNNIITLGKIKNDMKSYNPGYVENKMMPKLSDKILTFGFQGVGKWDNGKMDQDEFIKIKNNFINFVMSKKWGDKVLISVKPGSYWIYIHIKLK